MINLKLSLGQKELLIKFGKKKGRPKKTLFWRSQEFYQYLKKVYRDNRFKGNKISRVLRKIFEIKKIKEAIGINLALAIFLSGTISRPIAAPNFIGNEPFVYAIDEVKTTTERARHRPVDSLQISQGYHFFHRAIDFQETIGTSVYSIKEGVIKNTFFSRLGYGNYVVVEHKSGLTSLYAHLGKIAVQKGQKVDQNTTLGTVGTSGWATGPHLHLEVRENGKTINPLSLLK